MNITKAIYIEDKKNNCATYINATIDEKIWSVPLTDPNDRFYVEIMRQVDAGELTIEPADE